MLAIAMLVAGIFVNYGLRHGKLLGDYLSDDNLYLYQGLQLLEGFYARGVGGLLNAYHAEPPHCPLSAAAIATVFAVTGVTNAAPYWVMGSAVLALFFGSLVQLCGPMSRAGGWAVAGLLALLPLSQELVLELRPEYGYAVLVAAGVVLAFRESGPRWRREAVLAGAIWGAALLLKPPYTLLTLALAGYVWTAEEWLRARSDAPRVAGRQVAQRLAIKAAVLGLLAFPVMLRWQYYFDYVYANSYGRYASLWTLSAGFWERLLFQVTGPGGQRHLGSWLPVVVTLALLASIYVAGWGPAAAKRRVAVLVGALAIAVTAFYFARANNPHLGTPLQMLLLMSAAYPTSVLARCRLAARPRAAQILWAGAIVFGLWVFGFGVSQWGSLDQPAARDARALHAWALEAIRGASSVGERPNLFFTVSSRLMNTHSLRWVAAREGVPVNITERRESDDWEAQREGIAQADLILAAEAGAPGVHQWLPSAHTYVRACDYLRSRPQRFAEIAVFRPLQGGRYFLFRRIAAPP